MPTSTNCSALNSRRGKTGHAPSLSSLKGVIKFDRLDFKTM